MIGGCGKVGKPLRIVNTRISIVVSIIIIIIVVRPAKILYICIFICHFKAIAD